MPSAPERYVDWINHHVGFNPRGQGHSDFLTTCIVDDLIERCPPLGTQFRERHLQRAHNVGLAGKRHMSPIAASDEDDDAEIDPNIDGVVLPDGPRVPGGTQMPPLTIENKTIMTAHGKARTNRLNEARAYASHIHNSSPSTIAAFTIVINAAPSYRNPDAFARSAKSSGTNPASAAANTIELFTRMRLRNATTDPVGRCEAVLVLAHAKPCQTRG